jgi:hypothetical protein
MVIARIHDTDSDPTIFSEEVTERYYIPIIGQLFDTRIREMSASDIL